MGGKVLYFVIYLPTHLSGKYTKAVESWWILKTKSVVGGNRKIGKYSLLNPSPLKCKVVIFVLYRRGGGAIRDVTPSVERGALTNASPLLIDLPNSSRQAALRKVRPVTCAFARAWKFKKKKVLFATSYFLFMTTTCLTVWTAAVRVRNSSASEEHSKDHVLLLNTHQPATKDRTGPLLSHFTHLSQLNHGQLFSS